VLSLEAYAPEVGRGRAEGVRVIAGRSTTNVRIVLAGGAKSPDHAGATVAVTLGEIAASREVVVVVVADASEAERAGLQAGDVITDVDGVAVHTIEQARDKLGGPAGSDAVLGIKRGDVTSRIRVGREVVRR
jgi:C-terminal processing protease CtpA/Prc